MPPRMPVDVEPTTLRKLDAVAFVLRLPHRNRALDLAIEALLASDPALAAAVEAQQRRPGTAD